MFVDIFSGDRWKTRLKMSLQELTSEVKIKAAKPPWEAYDLEDAAHVDIDRMEITFFPSDGGTFIDYEIEELKDGQIKAALA